MDVDRSQFGKAGIKHAFLDETHRFIMKGTPIGKFRKPFGTSVKMDSCNFNMYMVSCILSLELQYKLI